MAITLNVNHSATGAMSAATSANPLKVCTPDAVPLDKPVDATEVKPLDRAAVENKARSAMKKAAWFGLMKRVGYLSLNLLGLAVSAFSLPYLGPLGAVALGVSGVNTGIALLDVVTAVANVRHVYRYGKPLPAQDDGLLGGLMWANARLGGKLKDETLVVISGGTRLVLNALASLLGGFTAHTMAKAGVAFNQLEHFGPIVVSAIASLMLTLEAAFGLKLAKSQGARAQELVTQNQQLHQEVEHLKTLMVNKVPEDGDGWGGATVIDVKL